MSHPMPGRMNVPVRFQGTPEQAAANRSTHIFIYWEDEGECDGCACKPWSAAAEYPCGTLPPREWIPAPNFELSLAHGDVSRETN